MDVFDGDSDLSDVSAPPTPGPAVTPRATSPEQSAAATTDSAETSAAEPATGPRRPANHRRAPRKATDAAAEPSTSVKGHVATSTASNSSATKSASAEALKDTPSSSSRRASTRDRKIPAKLREPSPAAESPRAAKTSPAAKTSTASASTAADTPKSSRLKVKLNVKPRSSADGTATGDSGSSRGATPQPSLVGASGTKVTLKYGNGKKNKLASELREFGDEFGEDNLDGDANQDESMGNAGQARIGKRDRSVRNRGAGRRRGVVADDEDEDGAAPMPPQRKRARLSGSPAVGAKGTVQGARGAKKAVDYSDDDDEDDEEMVDAASDEDDLADAAAPDTDDDFSADDGLSRKGGKAARKSNSDATKKTGARATAAAAKSSAGTGAKKATVTGSGSTATGGKAMSAEARMRASIDAAKDKSLKPLGGSSSSGPTASKLNPQASAFRPSGAIKSGAGGASTPTGTGANRLGSAAVGGGAAAAATANKRPSSGGGAKPAFGKSMSGWDQLFGGISGLTTPTSNKPTPTKTSKPSTPSTPAGGANGLPGTGIRPDPVLESASPAEVQRLKEQADQEHLNTDECFDLLAHADIMLAFERSVYLEDRKLATRLRPAFWKAGSVLQQPAKPQQERGA